MARYEGVSASVIRRLPRYHRFLYDLIQRDVHRISSRELAELMNLTASQIRQDLNCVGGFGQQGYGYNVDALYEEIGNILGLNKGRKIILLGAGNLGMALVKHLSFEAKGFRMIGIFDKNPKLIGQKIHGIEIMPESELESFCQKNKPDAAVLCLPKDVVEELGDRLISYGIRAFWNFSHYGFSWAVSVLFPIRYGCPANTYFICRSARFNSFFTAQSFKNVIKHTKCPFNTC